jgi:hypothetical protein
VRYRGRAGENSKVSQSGGWMSWQEAKVCVDLCISVLKAAIAIGELHD